MNKEQRKQIELRENRESLVVKGNDLIRHTRYDLSLSEQKILIYVISKIVAEDKDFKHIKFRIGEYCEIAGIKRGGTEYEYIKDSIQSLRSKSWWINLGRKETLFSWIDTASIENNTGEVDIVLSESLRPFLLDIRGNFTKYELINVLVLHSKYSIRLYEIFKSYLWLHKWEVSLDEFRERIAVGDKYKDFTEFKRNVILPSIKEINKFTDLQIEFETIKKGRKIDKLIFKIGEKAGYQMTMDVLLNQEERLSINKDM